MASIAKVREKKDNPVSLDSNEEITDLNDEPAVEEPEEESDGTGEEEDK